MSSWGNGVMENTEWAALMTALEQGQHRLPDLFTQWFADAKNEYDCDDRHEIEVLAPRYRALSNTVMLAAYPNVVTPAGYSVPPEEVQTIRSLVPAAVARRFSVEAVEQLSAIDDAYTRGADCGDERSEQLSVAMESDAELVLACDDSVVREFRRAENSRFAAYFGSPEDGHASSRLHALDTQMKERAQAQEALAKATKSGGSARRSEPSPVLVMALLVAFATVALIVATTT